MFNTRRLIPAGCIAWVFLLVSALPGYGAATLTVYPSGSGTFILQGAGLEGVAAIELDLSYDSASLRNPRVTQGSLVAGALMAVNPDAPGTIRIAMVNTNPANGAGQVAAVAFDRADGIPGRIHSINAKFANLNGQSLPVSVSIMNAPDPAVAAADSQGNNAPSPVAFVPVETGRAPAPAAILPPMGRGIFVPQGGAKSQPEAVEPPVTSTNEALPAVPQPRGSAQERPNIRERSPESKVRKVHAHTGALDRFKEYKGPGAMVTFLSFFEQDPLFGFRQGPGVVLADGKEHLRLTFISVPGERSSSEAALSGAKLISLARDPDYSNTWIADIQPSKGESSASMSIPQDGFIMIYPLNVAPAGNIDLDKSGSVTEVDFELFLTDRNAKIPRFDINGDGKRDYQDDYIFTANYLVKAGREGRKSRS